MQPGKIYHSYIYIFICILLFSIIPCSEAIDIQPKDVVIQSPSREFRVGERLTYTVRWMGVPVGKGYLSVEEVTTLDGHEVYHIAAKAETNKFISRFYRIEDYIHSFVDKEGLFSRKLEKKLQEGHYRAWEVMEYNQEEHTTTYKSLLNNSTKHMEIPERVHDILSFFYYFRTQDIEVGESLFLDVNTDEKNWKLEIEVLESGILEMYKMGVHEAFKIEPKVEFQGVSFRKGRLWIWFTADARRIPLIVEVETPYGTIIGALSKIE